MANKTPKHGTKLPTIPQPPQVLTFIPPRVQDGRKTGGYKWKRGTVATN